MNTNGIQSRRIDVVFFWYVKSVYRHKRSLCVFFKFFSFFYYKWTHARATKNRAFSQKKTTEKEGCFNEKVKTRFIASEKKNVWLLQKGFWVTWKYKDEIMTRKQQKERKKKIRLDIDDCSSVLWFIS